MKIFESFKIAIESILANKLRSLLTMLGIIIGVSSVITVVAIGQGGRAALNKEMDTFGANRFMVFYQESDIPFSDSDTFTLQDVDTIKSISPAIESLAPVSRNVNKVKNKGKDLKVSIIATSKDYQNIANLNVTKGRFLNDHDENGRRQVGIISYKLAEKLFGAKDPIGQKIMLENIPFQIVGVLAKSEGMFSHGQDENIFYMPISTYHSLYASKWVDNLEGKAVSGDDVESAISQVINILERRHRRKGRYQAWNAEKEMDAVRNVTGIVALVISIIAGISLLVGGIGIMNIMLVSVTERTREIGIRKALGAKESDILLQFLIESLVLSLIGGVIGMLLGFGISFVISIFAKMPPLFSWQMILVAFIFSAGVGVFFGIYPARKAAYQDPIEALRYE